VFKILIKFDTLSFSPKSVEKIEFLLKPDKTIGTVQ